jgi:hypothetical protein
VFQVQAPVRRSRIRGNLTMERLTPKAGMRIWIGAGGGSGVGVGVGDGTGVGVAVKVGSGVDVGVGNGVLVMSGIERAMISSDRKKRFWLMIQVFKKEYAA